MEDPQPVAHIVGGAIPRLLIPCEYLSYEGQGSNLYQLGGVVIQKEREKEKTAWNFPLLNYGQPLLGITGGGRCVVG